MSRRLHGVLLSARNIKKKPPNGRLLEQTIRRGLALQAQPFESPIGYEPMGGSIQGVKERLGSL
jgi:hypothetical protein